MEKEPKPKIEKLESEEKMGERSRERLSEARERHVSDRDIFEYSDELGIPITKEFLGENVLDLGSGKRATFAKEAAERGIRVFSLSPALIDRHYRNVLKEALKEDKEFKKKMGKLFLAGLAQELPFKSNSFDSVLSVYAVPHFIKRDAKDQEDTFREIIRVLKPGGKAYLAPVQESKKALIKRVIKKIEKEKLADVEFLKYYPGYQFFGMTLTKKK